MFECLNVFIFVCLYVLCLCVCMVVFVYISKVLSADVDRRQHSSSFTKAFICSAITANLLSFYQISAHCFIMAGLNLSSDITFDR